MELVKVLPADELGADSQALGLVTTEAEASMGDPAAAGPGAAAAA